jgi:hypothetical protein
MEDRSCMSTHAHPEDFCLQRSRKGVVRAMARIQETTKMHLLKMSLIPIFLGFLEDTFYFY